MRIDAFTKQHGELDGLAAELEKAAHRGDPTAVGFHMARMFGLLKVHLTMEDQSLYPMLRQSADPEVVETASRFEEEMGALREQVEAFGSRWTTLRIRDDLGTYVRDLDGLLGALRNRIQREENELYPLSRRV